MSEYENTGKENWKNVMVRFKTERISDRVTRIYGICTELMYLVEGEKQAALIDTGSGFGSLRTVAELLTDKPIIVLLTHGHTDHAMGAGEFDIVYMNHEDDYIYGPHGDELFRWEGVKMSEDYPEVTQADYVPTVSAERFRDMKGGDRFDLGGCTIDIYDCKGHTEGSVVMLIREERMLLLGDACNGNTFLFEEYSTSVEEYEENLRRLKNQVDGKYDIALASHGDGRLPVTVIDEVIQVCMDIQSGDTDDIPMTFRGNNGWIAKKTTAPGGIRADGKTGNIVYHKDKILRMQV